jgi:hypothetical protein
MAPKNPVRIHDPVYLELLTFATRHAPTSKSYRVSALHQVARNVGAARRGESEEDAIEAIGALRELLATGMSFCRVVAELHAAAR